MNRKTSKKIVLAAPSEKRRHTMAKRQKKWFILNVVYLPNIYDGTLVKSEYIYMYAYDITAAKRSLGKQYQLMSYVAVDVNSQAIEVLNKCKANAVQV